MKQAIIDIGSNSIRLTVYDTEVQPFKILFKEKIMAGLAGYVADGALTEEGIECAYNGLLDFKGTLQALNIDQVHLFATASLRNVTNTEMAVASIKAATGYTVEVISGEEEALFGYAGAMQEIKLDSGAFMDVGGASTEVVSFRNGMPVQSVSFPVGSLNLYRQCVKKILPGEGSLKRIQSVIAQRIDQDTLFSFDKTSPIVCVGGTSRAVLKLARKEFSLPVDCNRLSADQLDALGELLCRGDKTAADLILKMEPERIHTIIPGVLIMKHVFRRFDADEIIVSNYGVREGYLCQKILSDTPTHKTGS
jgi:exopolyphosphatase/guanosine-5'-triphosphate,3'-diphosphate pyrophosphatase